VLRVKRARLKELHIDEDAHSITLAFSTDRVELHPGHFLEGNAGGFTLAIFDSDLAVLTEDATPADIAATAQGHVRGVRR